MKVVYIIIFLLALPSLTYPQHHIAGLVVDRQGTPIPYATIGIYTKNIGTYSFENGLFSLSIPKNYLQEKLTVSCIGYETISVEIGPLLNQDRITITLKESISHLNDVLVTPKNNTTHLRPTGIMQSISNGDISIAFPHRGSEVGLVIDNGGQPVVLNKISVKFKVQRLDSILLQARIYTLNAEKSPGDLLEHRLIKKVRAADGECHFDLKETLQIQGPVFISFQWLADAAHVANIDQYNATENEVIMKYMTSEFKNHSITLYNKKKISVRNELGKEVWSAKMANRDIAFLKTESEKIPKVSFLTTKAAGTTLYRSHSLGRWYRYDQNLIAWIE